MSTIKITTTPPDLFARFERYPRQLDKVLKTTMRAALLAVWENVPAYPPKPKSSWYVRTGTLGRSLGVSEGGGKIGFPDVFKIEHQGPKYLGTFGSNLTYAPRVIDPDQQEMPWKRYWWTTDTIKHRAEPKVISLFEAMTEELAKFLGGTG